MPVRMVKREELLEFDKIQSVAFVFPMDVAEREKKLADEPDPVDPRIGFFADDNTMTACMVLPEYQMWYEKHIVRMVGVGGVASLPEYRFGGAIRQIFYESFRQMVASGTVFSALYPFSHPYYRKFGYELCQSSIEYEVPTDALKSFRFTGKARMFAPGDPIDVYRKIFDAHYSRYNMSIQRDERRWKSIFDGDPYKDRVYTYLLEDENGPCAYVRLAAQDAAQFEKTGIVREIAYAHPKGLMDVLGFLYRLSAQYTTMRIPLPDDVPLLSLVDECYELKGNYGNLQMTRVIDVKKALELKRHPENVSYTLRALDEHIPENDGVFSVRSENGSVWVEKLEGDAQADLTADVRTLTQLLLGYLSIDEAMYKKDVQVDGSLDTLRSVFVKRSVFLTDHF